jgi:acetyl-CoA carboxylase biotin carboxyl carrier protein
MNIKEVKDLIQEVLQSDISEFELEHSGTRLRLKRGFGNESAATPAFSPKNLTTVSSVPRPPLSEDAAVQVESIEEPEDSALHMVMSPIVGTVYRTPSPGVEPYVKVGDHVNEGTILCLVEAMKLMNEIPSDIEGEIARIYIENGNPVEFGQRLFAIRPQRRG